MGTKVWLYACRPVCMLFTINTCAAMESAKEALDPQQQAACCHAHKSRRTPSGGAGAAHHPWSAAGSSYCATSRSIPQGSGPESSAAHQEERIWCIKETNTACPSMMLISGALRHLFFAYIHFTFILQYIYLTRTTVGQFLRQF